MKNKDRFHIEKYNSSFLTQVEILTDRKTGVQYIYYQNGNGGGITLLVDKEGKPLINKDIEKDYY